MGILHDLQSDLEASAARLFSEYHDRLFAEAKGMGVNRDEAEDLVMVAFESFFAKRDRFNPKKGDIFAYLRGILHNAHKMSVRKIGRRIDTVYLPMEDLQFLSDKLVAGEVYGSAEDRADDELVRQAIASLSPKVREAIMLHYFEEKSVAETAQKLGISENAVKNRLFMARKTLARKLKGKLGKALAILGICFLGFGVFAAAGGLSLFQSEDQSATLPEAVPVEAQVATPAELEEPPRAEPIAPITTFENNENTETAKEEEPMKFTKTLKSAAVAAAMTLSAVNSAEAEGDGYLLSVNAGVDGLVKVTANGKTEAAVQSVELWLANGAPIKIEYIPNVAGDWRCFSGCPDDAEYVSPTITTFTMPSKTLSLVAMPFAYSDSNLVTCDGSVRATNTYEGRTVYIFTNATFKNAPVFLKRSARLEDLLVVAGGGGGAQGPWVSGGGGGGGVIYQALNSSFARGERILVTVGAGGATLNNGGNSVLTMGATTLTAVGGGAGGRADYGKAGGSGGGAGNGKAGGAGTVGQGYAGGASLGGAGSGGGGAENAGGNDYTVESKSVAGKGGDGRWDAIAGERHCYASGGGGSSQGSVGMIDEATGLPVFGEGGTESGGRGGFINSIPNVTWNDEWNYGHNGVDGLGGGGGAGPYVAGRGGCGTVILGFTAMGDARVLEFDGFDSYPIVDGAAKPEPEVRCGGITLEKGTDYDFFYEDNDKVGNAYLVIVGKGYYAGLTRRHLFSVNEVRFVKSVATGSGDGSDWDNAMGIADAIAGLANGSYEIWCQAGTYELAAGLTIPTYTAIRGGFAGDQTDSSRKDADGKKTVFDGCRVATQLFVSSYNCGASHFTLRPIAFEDCAFTRCVGTAISADSKSTPFTFKRCDFLNNESGSVSAAIVFSIRAASFAPVSFTSCHFEGNVNAAVEANVETPVIFLNASKLTMDSCLFVTNCMALERARPTYSNVIPSSQLISIDDCAESKISNCDFRGNFLARYKSGSQIVRLNNTSCVIESTSFVGNSFFVSGVYGLQDAVVYLNTSRGTSALTIRNCTFAYNVFDAKSESSGCVYIQGWKTYISNASIENCIFWQNRLNAGNAGKSDVVAGAAATVSLTYSLFADLDPSGAYINLAPEVGCIAGNPRFETKNAVDDYMLTDCVALDPAKINEILAISVQETSFSPAVNTGNPKSDWSKEPVPNGKRINMGCYGGTSEAACTPPGMAVRVR